MPKCVVTKCPHQTGKKARYPEIVLHPFPKDIKLIQEWLRLAGMEEENLELVSFEILEDRRSDKFRMCSAHFTKDCYVSKGTKRVLKADAKPSKFPEKTVLDFAQPPMMHRIAKRARIEQSLTSNSSTRKAECSCKCHKRLKSRLVNASTQTEFFDGLLPALVQQDFTAEEATDTSMMSPLDMTTIKHWERTEFHIKQEETQSENGFLSLKDTRSSTDGSLKEKPTIACDVPSFNIITVDSWETIKAHTEQEYNPTENGLLHSEDILEKNTNDGAFLYNGKDLITTIKKENDVNGYSHPEETVVNMNETPTDKPICSTALPGTRNRKRNRVQLRTVKPCNENGHLPDQSSTLPTDISKQPQQKKETNKHNDTSRLTKPKCSESFLTEELASWSMEEIYAEEKKYVVYESCLDVLLLNMRCQHNRCSERIREFDKQMVGSLLVVYGTCCLGHHGKLWESRPRVNGIGARNVLLAALLVLTGLNVTKIKELCDVIAQQMSGSSIHQYEDVFISQRINQGMKEEKESEVISETEQEDTSWDRGRRV